MSLSDGLVFWRFIPILILLIFSGKASARSLQLRDLPLHSVVQIGSYDYVKVADNAYMQSSEVTCPDGATVGGMYVKCFTSESSYDDQCSGSSGGNCDQGSYCGPTVDCTNGTFEASDNPSSSTIASNGYEFTYDCSTKCTCNKGYRWNSSALKCEYSGCGIYGHMVNNQCVCDTGYAYNDVLARCTNMQDFTADDCSGLGTVTGTNYIAVGELIDGRDGKYYEVRKFSDGVCWMVTNLKYGGSTLSGGTDACASKTTFSGNGQAAVTNRFGTNTYGDCLNPGAKNTAYANNNYGYLYNWQAAMQHTTAYYGVSYTGSQTNVTGLCPSGWVLPTSNSTTNKGSFGYLHAQAGSPSSGFWQGGNWKGVYSGYCDASGTLYSQTTGAHYWSSTQSNAIYAYNLSYNSSSVSPSHNSNKSSGFAIRCLHF